MSFSNRECLFFQLPSTSDPPSAQLFVQRSHVRGEGGRGLRSHCTAGNRGSHNESNSRSEGILKMPVSKSMRSWSGPSGFMIPQARGWASSQSPSHWRLRCRASSFHATKRPTQTRRFCDPVTPKCHLTLSLHLNCAYTTKNNCGQGNGGVR